MYGQSLAVALFAIASQHTKQQFLYNRDNSFLIKAARKTLGFQPQG
jgi:hypothetical protein